MARIEVVSHREKRAELLALNHETFRPGVSLETWAWKYEQNPLVAGEPTCIVAAEDGRIVGSRPIVPCEVWVGQEKTRAFFLADTSVHPAYQGRGIWWQMNMFALDHYRREGYSFLWTFPGPKAAPGNLKQGFTHVLSPETLFRPINWKNLVSWKMESRLAATILAFLGHSLLRTREGTYAAEALSSVRLYDEYPDALAEINILLHPGRIELVRSEEFLRWLFDRRPERRHQYVLGWDSGRLCAYAVTAVYQQEGVTFGGIVDCLVRDDDPGYLQALVGECLRVLAEEDVDVCYVRLAGQPLLRRELMQRFGFRSSAGFPFNRVGTPGNFFVRELDPAIVRKANIFDPDNWRLTEAYTG
ncbi:MAG: GNAT family N-acetyltransferase [Chloroflexota bacterium]